MVSSFMSLTGRVLKKMSFVLAVLGVSLATVWAAAALYVDLPNPMVQHVVAITYLIVIFGILVLFRAHWAAVLASLAAFACVLIWWLSLKPSNYREWQPDVAQTAWAEISGDQITIHNVRNCEYRAEFDYTPRWETRTVHLSKLRGID